MSLLKSMFMALLGIIFLISPQARAQEGFEQPVDLVADQVIHDEESQTVTAVGNVELVQDARVLKADLVTYNLSADQVTATGNVSFLDENGDVYFAEKMILKDRMKTGFADALQGLLTDGSRFAAAEAERIGGTKYVFRDAVYTPCEPCKENPSKPPIWQIRASEVTLDKEKQSVKYKNARFELGGIPMLYTPYFSHPDPAIDRRSGFLRPGLGWTSELGAIAKGAYYWDIAPDKDMTLSAQLSSEEGLLVGAEYRQRFERGRLFLDGKVTKSDRVTQRGGVEAIDENNNRAYLFANGAFDINNLWRLGFQYDRASDKQFLRQYDIKEDDILESRFELERFEGRNYSRIAAFSFQDLRLGDRPDQPDVIPLAEHIMLGEPESLFGGRWIGSASVLGLTRGSGGQDVNRGSIMAGWDRRMMSNTGLITDISLMSRGDFYSVRDRQLGGPGADDSFAARAFPRMHLKSSLPYYRNFKHMQAILEPIASFTYGTNLDEDDTDIPNEDSVDVQIDTSNLFSPNRFPGVDEMEDGAHVAYGFKTSFHGYQGNRASVFVGQSYRLSEDDNLFPENSGLEGDSSDYVGEIKTDLGNILNLQYKFQFDEKDLDSRLHEFQGTSRYKNASLGAKYIFAKQVTGTGFTESREQIRISPRLQLNDNWSVSGSALTDLGEQPGLRTASAGITYNDECFSFSLLGNRQLLSRASGESETTLFVRIGLKHIGEFSTPKFLLQGEGEEN